MSQLDDAIERIKSTLQIAPFLAPYTNGLVSSGNGFFIGRCPFHQSADDPPSKRKFWVNASGGTCGCFTPRCTAYCNQAEDPNTKPLDIISFVMRTRNVDINTAVTFLLELCP